MNSNKYTNSLIKETSPYLLQHAHNPVNWVAWSEETFEKAKQEKKLVLISVGYSSCHWCHVMEHESFEDEDVAKIMNDFFICIKVDREERPDVDQIYMHAVQLMTGHGGWPLNCFALPDGKPIYGGTYFRKEQWKNILLNLADLYKNESEKIYDYAEQLLKGINHSDEISKNDSENISKEILETTIKNWSKGFDNFEGGMNKAPKFPMPNNYLFLLRYAHLSENKSLLNHVLLTLNKIAFGGIYDHLGGGFARYSTDHLWKVPHFEKMLYDNAQLISLYSEAYQLTKKELYKNVVYETIEFIHREFTSSEGVFYSALDADSEGIEGKYYVWTKKELENILGNNFPVFAEYYNVNSLGYWEEENYILLRKHEESEIAAKFNITKEVLSEKIKRCKNILLTIRNQRIRPGLDDKCLASWNGMMLKALADAYLVFGEEEFLLSAKKNAHFILNKYKKADGGLNHSYKNGKAHINGFLEDYAFVAEGLISLYEASLEEIWLNEAKQIVDYAIEHFSDSDSDLLFFTSKFSEKLIFRKKEVHDNVTPASNSSLAKSLFALGKYFSKPEYINKSRNMLSAVVPDIPTYGSSYSNWCLLMTNFVFPHYELAIVGKGVDKIREQLRNYYLPNKIFAGSKSTSSLSLLENRFVNEKTLIYVCENNTCKLPVSTLEDALKQMNAQD